MRLGDQGEGEGAADKQRGGRLPVIEEGADLRQVIVGQHVDQYAFRQVCHVGHGRQIMAEQECQVRAFTADQSQELAQAFRAVTLTGMAPQKRTFRACRGRTCHICRATVGQQHVEPKGK